MVACPDVQTAEELTLVFWYSTSRLCLRSLQGPKEACPSHAPFSDELTCQPATSENSTPPAVGPDSRAAPASRDGTMRQLLLPDLPGQSEADCPRNAACELHRRPDSLSSAGRSINTYAVCVDGNAIWSHACAT